MEVTSQLSKYIHFITILIVIVLQVEAKKHERNKQVYCGACLALVDELNWNIASISTKKKIQVGSFRVDSRGNQGLHEVPLARSEVQLYEFLEEVCLQMQHYAESSGSEGRINYIRTSARDGQKVSLKNIKISDRKQQSLRYACDTILEENEDDLIKLLRAATNDNGDEVTNSFCVDTLAVCTKDDVIESRQARIQSVIDGEKEAEEEERMRKINEELEAEREGEEDDDEEEEEEEKEEDADGEAESLNPEETADTAGHKIEL